VKIWDAQPFSNDFFENSSPGEIVFKPLNHESEFVVKFGKGSILVKEYESNLIVINVLRCIN
jgi:hypothetical protein